MIVLQQVFYCNQKLSRNFDIYSRVLSATSPYQALTIMRNTRNNLNNQTFTFIQIFSSRSTRLKIGTSASRPIHSSQVIVKSRFVQKLETQKSCPKPLSSILPQSSACSGLSPPAPPSWLCPMWSSSRGRPPICLEPIGNL